MTKEDLELIDEALLEARRQLNDYYYLLKNENEMPLTVNYMREKLIPKIRKAQDKVRNEYELYKSLKQ